MDKDKDKDKEDIGAICDFYLKNNEDVIHSETYNEIHQNIYDNESKIIDINNSIRSSLLNDREKKLIIFICCDEKIIIYFKFIILLLLLSLLGIVVYFLIESKGL